MVWPRVKWDDVMESKEI